MKKSSLFLVAFLASVCIAASAQVSPFMGLGQAQFFDNNGSELTTGVLYSFAAGTSTQQATYTDYTGLTLNPDPIPFTTGGRVGIWLTSSLSYKFVLCLQNDGATCAPADVLFSVDHVPGCAGCASSGSPFTGTFISGSPNPATTGILELASGDSICWRNQANTFNLCISKDTSDILEWAGGTVKLPEVSCAATAASFEYLCPNSSTHRLSISNNNGTYAALPTVPSAATPSHLAGFLPSGYDLQDSGATAPVSTPVTFSSTPIFTATSQDQLFTMTLTGNVTSSTLVMTGLPTPSLVSFELTQDATGSRTFVWPANVLNVPSNALSATANTLSTFHFVWDGTNLEFIGPLPPTSASQLATAWVTFTVTATVVTVQSSYNVTSVVRNSAGLFTITFTTAMADASYNVEVGAQAMLSGATVYLDSLCTTNISGCSNPTTTNFQVCGFGVPSGTVVLGDMPRFDIVVFGK